MERFYARIHKEGLGTIWSAFGRLLSCESIPVIDTDSKGSVRAWRVPRIECHESDHRNAPDGNCYLHRSGTNHASLGLCLNPLSVPLM